MISPPIFLESYRFIDKLVEWKDGKEGRSWELCSSGIRAIRCTLNWKIGNQLAGVDRTAMTAQEAVWTALEEFTKCRSE